MEFFTFTRKTIHKIPGKSKKFAKNISGPGGPGVFTWSKWFRCATSAGGTMAVSLIFIQHLKNNKLFSIPFTERGPAYFLKRVEITTLLHYPSVQIQPEKVTHPFYSEGLN